MNINEIIYHKIIDKITFEEEIILNKWLKESSVHQKMYEEMLDQEHFSDTYKTYSQIDIDSAWQKIIESNNKEKTTSRIFSIIKYAWRIL